MKLVVRADDVGYSQVCNIGTFETLDNGIITSVDIMFDTPGTVDALERLWVAEYQPCLTLLGMASEKI